MSWSAHSCTAQVWVGWSEPLCPAWFGKFECVLPYSSSLVKLKWTSFFDLILWVGVRPHEISGLGEFKCSLMYNLELRKLECIFAYSSGLGELECTLMNNSGLAELDCTLACSPGLSELVLALMYSSSLGEFECALMYSSGLGEFECTLICTAQIWMIGSAHSSCTVQAWVSCNNNNNNKSFM